jgi:hypothetical protein
MSNYHIFNCPHCNSEFAVTLTTDTLTTPPKKKRRRRHKGFKPEARENIRQAQIARHAKTKAEQQAAINEALRIQRLNIGQVPEDAE